MDGKLVATVGGGSGGGGGDGGGSCGSDSLGEQIMRINPAGDEDGSNGRGGGTPPPPFPCASGSLMSGCKGGIGPSGRPKQCLRVEEEKQDGADFCQSSSQYTTSSGQRHWKHTSTSPVNVTIPPHR
ncbi:hypothetical protein Vretimale_18300 [Volvox reticuliferus]|uniref:Uncharacterized protein n=1 Tax=Volvox reticuliferus TaxID=1737510 RepID=A0A8J4LZA7_9CHLO|nr:hypothetical protein Vretimale_18300 [Volvox reticuliferus]